MGALRSFAANRLGFSRAERLRTYLWFQVLHRLPPINLKLRTRHGILKISNKDQVIGRLLFTHREFELEKIELAMSLLRCLGLTPSTKMVLDIGANIGTVVLPLMRDSWFAAAIAIEPEIRNFDLLEENIRLNGMSGKVDALNIALSDHEGIMRLQLSPDNFGDHRIVVNIAEPGRELVDVPVHRLDDVLAQRKISSKEVGLIWMDVQGHEYHVLKGAAGLLSDDVPLLMEFWPFGLVKAGVDLAAYVDLLRCAYSRFHDLAEVESPAQPIDDLFRRFDWHRDDGWFTDLLFVR